MNRSQHSNTRAVQSLIQLVQTFADTKVVKSEVDKLSKIGIESYHDENNLDVLHHAIIANNIEAVTVLFFKGYFLPPHEYCSISYMHLAAKLGHRTILGLLLQDRPHDNKATIFKYQSASQKHYIKPTDGDERSEVTPLDVAGKGGHIRCVKLILDHCLGRYHDRNKFSGKDAHINMACQLDSPSALRLLLSESPTDDDVKSAVGAALKLAKPECLDILLRLYPDLRSLFGGMNLYHVLYSYSFLFDNKWVEALPTVTTVLIRHGHSVASNVPFRTYPLYSLLCLYVKCYDMPEKLPYIIACIVLLLNAGANPNFDEIEFEIAHENLNVQTAFGRLAYSTGLHCFYSNICSLNLHFDEGMEFTTIVGMLQHCTEIFLRHGAKLQQIGRVNEDGSLVGTALHSFCDMSILIGLDTKTLALLLKYGADPEIECNGLYPVSLILEQFCCCTVEKLTIKDLDIFLNILNMMSYKCVKEIMDDTIEYKTEDTSEQMIFKNKIISFMADILNDWTLKKECQYLILKNCKRKMTKVLKLPIPMPLKTEIITVTLNLIP
ncbi:uncharacterized protein [Mytilus edulis]|uniref:uncharacterized protein n=1 Tax=Mytilus edulis TaxID=6550 RepID=UPI0039EFDA43